MSLGPGLLLAVHLGLQASAAPVAPPPPVAPPAPRTPRPTVVVVDDRAVKDQAPAQFITRAIEELERRRGLVTLRMSEGRRRLDPRADRALAACSDDAGCLAAGGRDMGGDIVVTLRLTRREGASFLAVTRVNALRPQMADDEGTLAGTDQGALAAVPEALSELFADTELEAAPRGPPAP